MGYEKFTEGNNEFCKEVSTTIIMKTKADIIKEQKNFLQKKATITEAMDAEEAKLNEQLAVFDK